MSIGPHEKRLVVLAWMILSSLIASPIVRADVLQLRNGSTIQGRCLNLDDKSATEWIVELEGGSQISLPRSDVKGITPRPPVLSFYEQHVAKASDSLETHRKIIDDLSKLSLNSLAASHWERVVELDPSNKTAWAALGYISTSQGWVPRDQLQRQRGLVQKGSRWYMPQQLAIEDANEAATVRKAEMNKAILKAMANIRTNSKKADESRQFILSLNDPLAVNILRDIAEQDRSKTSAGFRRQLYDVIGRIQSIDSVNALVAASLDDPDDSLRIECIEKLKVFGTEAAIQQYLQRLVNAKPQTDDPTKFDRAGYALSVLGDERCLPRLIDCLVTKHLRAPPSQPQFNVGQTSDGNAGLTQGSKKPVEVRVQNDGVLGALIEISGGENFGFEPDRWLNWYAEKFAARNFYVNRDP